VEFANGATALFDADRTAATAQVRPPVDGHAFIAGTIGNLRLNEDGVIFPTRAATPRPVTTKIRRPAAAAAAPSSPSAA